MLWLWKHMSIKSCCVVLHIRESPQECGNVYAGILKIQITYTTKVYHPLMGSITTLKKKKKRGEALGVFRNLRAYRKRITLLICSCCIQKAPQGKWFPKGATWDVEKSQESHSSPQNFLVSSYVYSGNCGWTSFEVNNCICLFRLPSIFWVFIKHVSVIYTISLSWQFLLVRKFVVTPLGTLMKYIHFWVFLSSLCCYVSLYFLPYNLWTLIWSQRTQKDH